MLSNMAKIWGQTTLCRDSFVSLNIFFYIIQDLYDGGGRSKQQIGGYSVNGSGFGDTALAFARQPQHCILWKKPWQQVKLMQAKGTNLSSWSSSGWRHLKSRMAWGTDEMGHCIVKKKTTLLVVAYYVQKGHNGRLFILAEELEMLTRHSKKSTRG